MRRAVPTVVTGLVVVTTSIAGCGSSSSAGAVTAVPGPSGKLTVLAAASLTETFTELGRQFEATHPGTRITFSFGASSTLASQAIQQAPADVFASASQPIMDRVVAAGAATSPVAFARNVMQIAVPPDDPAHVTGVADLARPGVTVALCAVTVPCGAVARQVFSNAGIAVTPVTNETDVKAVLTKVELGEVDAGVVYVSDVRAAGSKVIGITVPGAVNASTTYPIATLAASGNLPLARAFVDYVRSDEGAAVLTAAGFAKP